MLTIIGNHYTAIIEFNNLVIKCAKITTNYQYLITQICTIQIELNVNLAGIDTKTDRNDFNSIRIALQFN